MKNYLLIFCIIFSVCLISCNDSISITAYNSLSQVPGYHWHTSVGGERFLVEDKTGHILYWMYENGAGSCTVQEKADPIEFTEEFLTCDAAQAAVELREKTKRQFVSAGPEREIGKPK